MLITTSLSILSLYIIYPTITSFFQTQEQRDKMFSSKRQDKYTTGLINTRNDCFANSSIQAFAAMPGLDVYLNDILKQHKLLSKLPISTESGELPKLPLHEALATIVHELQETITTEHYVSVWPFLQVIEKIFNSKISANQNDAHELVQLILETLDNENSKFKKFVKQNNLNFVITEFPFNGLLADQLTCLSCLNSSKPSFHPFAVLSLAVPQATSTSLEEMLKQNEVETINGYNCLRCKIKAILKVEVDHSPSDSNPETKELITKLQEREHLITINDDLPEDLDKFVKNYNYEGFKTESLQSTIVKKTLVVKSPRLLTVHLSRSMFTGTQVTRNSCRVHFEDALAIDVDETLARTHHKKQKLAKKLKKGIEPSLAEEEKEDDENDNDADDDDDDDEDIEGYDEDRNEPQQLARIHSKVLTSHEENASYTDPEEDQSETTNQDQFSDNSQSQSDNTSPESDGHPDDEEDEDEDEDSIDSEEDHELNASKEKVRYRLRAVIRHHGTHNAGHYECYRHKPALVKDTLTDTVVNTSATINFGEDIPEATPEVAMNSNEEIPEVPGSPSQLNSASPSADGGIQRRRSTRLRKLSERVSNRPSGLSSPTANGESLSRSSVLDDAEELNSTDDDPSHFTKFRNRIGSFVSRRPSVSISTSNVGSRRGSVANIPQPMIQSNSQSSAGVAELQEGFSSFQLQNTELNSKSRNKRFKKIATVSKYPFWRISDTRVAEVKKDDVLRETQAVYMIYYERV